jgi:hypothetical protein
MRYKQYFIWSGLSFLAICLVAGAINIVADPYWIYRVIDEPGFNQKKPYFSNYVRMGKAHSVSKIKPAGLILGSSTAFYGYDPSHPGWQVSPVYNLGLGGATIYEIYRYYQHALAQSEIKKVVLVLDFFMFDKHEQFRSNYSDARLLVKENGDTSRFVGFSDYGQSLFSMNALNHSIRTLIEQESLASWLSDGTIDYNVRRATIKGEGGHECVSLRQEKRFIQWFSSISRQFEVAINKQDAQYTYFKKILQLTIQNDIELHIIFPPSHIKMWEIIYLSGNWEHYSRWRSNIAELVDTEKQNNSQSRITLWNFSKLNTMTMEAFPDLGDQGTTMKHYLEFLHYVKPLGDLVLDQVFGNIESASVLQGEQVNRHKLNQNQISKTSKLVEYMRNNQREVNVLNDLKKNRFPSVYNRYCS